MWLYYICFFFKQKTAYDLRISDWSSDVCSSDLIERRNSSPAMPASRAVEETRMPDAPPPQRSVVASIASTFANALPSRTTTPGKPPSRTMRLDRKSVVEGKGGAGR